MQSKSSKSPEKVNQMMERFTVSVDDSNGEIKFLVSDLSKGLLDETSIINRASHVEPCFKPFRLAFYGLRAIFGEYGTVGQFTRLWPCLWRVNLSPINGPILPNIYRDRLQAIDAEIVYLENHFL
jgi:hypothetical protein